MRWAEQVIDKRDEGAAANGAAAPGLFALRGLVRSVQTPEFSGVTFHEVLAKSALNRVPASSSMPFGWTVNPYRGCSHACVYCFARNTHRYLDFDAGSDFDQQVVVKVNVADVLRAEVSKRSWCRASVALGTNTDPYQRAEGRYALMPGIISALADSGTPMSILTKGTLLRRDLPLLGEAATQVPIEIAMSIAVFDDELQRAVEPGTPSTAARLATVRAATDAGFRVTVFLMPILPWLTDRDDQLDSALARIAEAGAARVVFGALHLRPGAKEWFLEWIAREHPELQTGYRRFYGSSSYAPAGYRRELARRVRPLLRRHGLDAHEDEDQPEQRRFASAQAASARAAAGGVRRGAELIGSGPAALHPAPQPTLF
ncbi:Rv2578c family radical SAM protein [Pseudoclavibacter endophyticus]|uniref:Radical SAM protein n=1 Tax=Pseudoclavibacter endophyticus TaxID=1778590 RepID=A0A6H9WK48_9MICO|nr:Rv2578c family radical SAM protein [Pseudoclavibacter endophyticus]KAB1648109.1 radical SAM protein [Pseudoclavibacter endophyticus]